MNKKEFIIKNMNTYITEKVKEYIELGYMISMRPSMVSSEMGRTTLYKDNNIIHIVARENGNLFEGYSYAVEVWSYDNESLFDTQWCDKDNPYSTGKILSGSILDEER